MKAPNRQREVQLKFRVTSEERALIGQKMEQLGTTNMAAYLRKMAVDGYAVNLELPELREMVSLLRRSSNNLNQLTRRVHETGRFYDADLEELRQSYDKLWDAAQKILKAAMSGKRAVHRTALLNYHHMMSSSWKITACCFSSSLAQRSSNSAWDSVSDTGDSPSAKSCDKVMPNA